MGYHPPMPLPPFPAVCRSIDLIAKDVYDIRFSKAPGFQFKAGQYVMFDIPHPDNPADIQARAYSIASAPHEPEVRFVIRLLPGGRMSRFIVEKLKPGMELTMRGPLGIFTYKPDQLPVVLVGTSTGIGPYRSMIADAIERQDARPVDLVYGVRHEEDLFWEEELRALADKHPDMRLHIALTQPRSPHPLLRGEGEYFTGRVQHIIPQVITDITKRRVYLCGNPAMVKEVKQLCLNNWGLTKDRIHAEEYI